MFLILDFTNSFKMAILSNNILIEKELKTKKNISEMLIFEIEKFFKKHEKNIKKIKTIYVITGPGSFTGIRSALTFAKSLKLTIKLNIFGLSKFEIINYKVKIAKCAKLKCILLHFKGNQFFKQTFRDNKAINEVQLIDFDNEKLNINRQTVYIYDDILLESHFRDKISKKIKENFYLVSYNFQELKEIIIHNMIVNNDPKPLYISNYY